MTLENVNEFIFKKYIIIFKETLKVRFNLSHIRYMINS